MLRQDRNELFSRQIGIACTELAERPESHMLPPAARDADIGDDDADFAVHRLFPVGDLECGIAICAHLLHV